MQDQHANLSRLMRFARLHGAKRSSDRPEDVLNALTCLENESDSSIELLMPLIMHQVEQKGLRGRLDPMLRHDLDARAWRQQLNTERARDWVCGFKRTLKKSGVPIVLLKGAAFDGTIYPRGLSRGSADVDLLVRKADFDKINAILSSECMRESQWTNRRVSLAVNYEHGFVVGGAEAPVLVEVHRGLTNPLIFAIDENDLWDGTSRHSDYKSEFVRVLSWENHLLHLAVHGYRHLDLLNHNLLDVHEIVSSTAVDWGLLVARAQKWEATTSLFLLLEAAEGLMDTPVPSFVLDQLRPAAAKMALARALYRYRRNHALGYGQFSYRAAQLLGQLLVPDSLMRATSFQVYYSILRGLDLYDATWRKRLR